MLKKCIKTELRKAFFNKALLIALAIAVALSLIQAIHAVRVLEEYQTGFEMGWLTGNPMITAISLFARWLSAYELLTITLVLPFITIVAIGLIQLCLTLFLKRIHCFLAMAVLLFASAYYQSPIAIGN